MSDIANSSPPQTPTRQSARLQELVLAFTPNKSGHELGELRAEAEAMLDTQSSYIDNLQHRLVDAENEHADPVRRARRGRNHRTDGLELDTDGPSGRELEDRARSQGRKYAMLYSPFLSIGTASDYDSFFMTPRDPSFDPTDRFSADAGDEYNLRQSQLLEIEKMMSKEVLVDYMTSTWFPLAFTDGMDEQIRNSRTRLRHAALPSIRTDLTFEDRDGAYVSVTPAHLATPDDRKHIFGGRIGLKAGTTNQYRIWNIPIFHLNEPDAGDYENFKVDWDTVFRHPILPMVFVAFIRGPSAPARTLNGDVSMPRGSCMQRLHNILSVKPGTIALCAVWVIFLFSEDETFERVGGVTGINYYERFNEYLDKISNGLILRQRWARDLLAYWNQFVFGSSNAGLGAGSLTARAQDRDEIADATASMMDMPVVSDDEDMLF
ncbi:hypothetical protein GGX14DRAFT_553482 [Mycena pura]|uniref:Uncharacterized protein n=1 Tax=Mycena pura TaxID=153505 RepID=A0AAD6YUP3_9AGAR|nr:hypothetical protein GGX14DRAFT_553482 [Mycena pura]